jgi:hypothetical protein
MYTEIKQFLCLVVILMPSIVSAALVSFEQEKDIVQTGDRIVVAVLVDTQGKTLNAIEGSVAFGGNELSLVRILDGESVINFWVQEPKQEGDSVRFSGITPGGFTGRDNNLLTFEFEAKKEGVASVAVKDIQLLLHDGLGTPVEVVRVPLAFNILGQSDASTIDTVYVDTEEPEAFVPIIAYDKDVFDGRAFIVFSTEDKGTGIDYYEVKEGEFADYRRATSPYELRDQNLQNVIYVKAVDKEGYEYIATIYPQSMVPWYQTNIVKVAILIVCLIVSLLFFRRLFRSSSLR